MNKKLSVWLIPIICGMCLPLWSRVAPHVISFFMRPLASEQEKQEKNGAHRILGYHPHYTSSGIIVLYSGRAALSSLFGQVLIGRRQTEPKVSLLITRGLEPLHVNPFTESTIWGFGLNPELPAELYELERKKDPETGLDAWFVEKKERPAWREVPYKTMVIWADPNEIIVPTGMFFTKAQENFLLPDIYVSRRISPVYNTFKFFKIRNFFKPVKKEFRQKDDLIEERIVSS